MGKVEGIVEEIVKNLVNEMAKEGSSEDAEKDTGIPKRKQEIGKVTFSKDGDTKFTVTDIDTETGKVSWSVEKLPSKIQSKLIFVDSSMLYLNKKNKLVVIN